MLATTDTVDIDDYLFKSSPESSGDDSFVSDYLDNPSDEDFLQQLSSDLDIPLLLNAGEDEMSLLNSFFDKSPEEILSDIAAPKDLQWEDEGNELDELHKLDLTQFGPEAFPNVKAEVRLEANDVYMNEYSPASSLSPSSPVSSHSSEGWKSPLQTLQIKIEDDTPGSPLISPETNIFFNDANKIQSSIVPSETTIKNDVHSSNPNVAFTHKSQAAPQNINLKIMKLPQRRLAISPKAPYAIPAAKTKQKIVIVPSAANAQVSNVPATSLVPNSMVGSSPQKVVILDNIATTGMPMTSVTNFKTVTTAPCVTAMPNSVAISNGLENITAQVSIPTLSPPAQNLVLTRGQIIDTRALKRQQRMIKNRESACLSRKKKKDYVTSLEIKVLQLSEENEKLKLENTKLKEQLGQQSKIPMLNLPSRTVTKTIAVCALFCVMSLNINYLQSPLLNSDNGLSSIKSGELPLYSHHQRSLLWAPDTEDSAANSDKNKTANMLSLPMCPMHINQSENVRLARELHKLIGKPYNISSELFENARFGKNGVRKKEKHLKNNSLSSSLRQSLYKVNRRNRRIAYSSINSELQIFSPTSENLYAEFFEAINRQDDTFYLVSLSPDHLLLPALNHNKTRRPKMSLLLPSLLPNVTSTSQSSTVSLMQIDCEVLDTRLLHVKYGVIPQHLRAHGNTTQENNMEEDAAHGKNSTVDSSHKPYFMRKSYLKFKDPTDIYSERKK